MNVSRRWRAVGLVMSLFGRRSARLIGAGGVTAVVVLGAWLVLWAPPAGAGNHEIGAPFDMVILIDASESVTGGDNAWLAEATANLIIESLQITLGEHTASRIAVLPFLASVDASVPLQPLQQQSKTDLANLGLAETPGTDFVAALRAAYDVFCPDGPNTVEQARPRRRLVLLITDGEPHVTPGRNASFEERLTYLEDNVQTVLDRYTTGQLTCTEAPVGSTLDSERGGGQPARPGGYDLLVLGFGELPGQPSPYASFWQGQQQDGYQDHYRYFPITTAADLPSVFELLTEVAGVPLVAEWMDVDAGEDMLHTTSDEEVVLFIPVDPAGDRAGVLVATNEDTGEVRPFAYGGAAPAYVLGQLPAGRWRFQTEGNVAGTLLVSSRVLPTATWTPTPPPTATSTPPPTPPRPTATPTVTPTPSPTATAIPVFPSGQDADFEWGDPTLDPARPRPEQEVTISIPMRMTGNVRFVTAHIELLDSRGGKQTFPLRREGDRFVGSLRVVPCSGRWSQFCRYQLRFLAEVVRQNDQHYGVELRQRLPVAWSVLTWWRAMLLVGVMSIAAVLLVVAFRRQILETSLAQRLVVWYGRTSRGLEKSKLERRLSRTYDLADEILKDDSKLQGTFNEIQKQVNKWSGLDKSKLEAEAAQPGQHSRPAFCALYLTKLLTFEHAEDDRIIEFVEQRIRAGNPDDLVAAGVCSAILINQKRVDVYEKIDQLSGPHAFQINRYAELYARSSRGRGA